jgi:hypothetical protein
MGERDLVLGEVWAHKLDPDRFFLNFGSLYRSEATEVVVQQAKNKLTL